MLTHELAKIRDVRYQCYAFGLSERENFGHGVESDHRKSSVRHVLPYGRPDLPAKPPDRVDVRFKVHPTPEDCCLWVWRISTRLEIVAVDAIRQNIDVPHARHPTHSAAVGLRYHPDTIDRATVRS